MIMALIKVKNVHKVYTLEKTEITAVQDVSLEIQAGERVCLMGPSGSGKSTLLNIIGCVDQASKGDIFIDGEDANKLSDAHLSDFRNRTMGFIFQNFNLIPVLSVFENIEYPLLLQRVSSKDRKKRVQDLLDKVGLADYGKRSPEKLSGGQRQRVAIARALVTNPKLVIADEPTASLDHATGKIIMELMVEMNRSAGSTLVFATHDPTVAEFAGRVVSMIDGQVIEDRSRS
jgi:putative ABC transport system ATP-binding protein